MYEGLAEHLFLWLEKGWAPPFRIHLFPTDSCNLRCRSCWRWKFPTEEEKIWLKEELPDDRLLSIVDEARALGVKEWELSGGGEPLLRKDIALKMMEKIKNSNMRGEMTTNGTLFTPEIVRFMLEIGWDNIILSLDGPNPEINDYLRPPQGSFQKIISMLELFKKYKDCLKSEKPGISIQCVLSKINIDYIIAMVKLAAEYEVKVILFEPVKLFSNRCSELMLGEDAHRKIRQQSKEATDIASKHGIYTNVDWLSNQPEYIRKIGKLDEFLTTSQELPFGTIKKDPFFQVPCYEPWYRMFIASNGRVSACCLADYSETENLRDKTLLQIWQGKYFTNFRKMILNKNFPESCKQCNASLRIHSDSIRRQIVKLWDDRKTGRDASSTNINICRKETLNICLVSREYPPETDWGGIGKYTHLLAHGLADLGHRVHVIAQSLDTDKEYMDGDVFVHRIAHHTFFIHKGFLKEFALRLEYSFRVYAKIKELIKKFNIDIIEGPNFSGETFVYSLHKKIPLITRLHTHFSEVIQFLGWPKTVDRYLSCWLENATILNSDLVICSTQKHRDFIYQDVGLNFKNIEIIPLGVPQPTLNCYDNDANSKENNLNILFVGRLEKRKGIHVLTKAIPHVLEEMPEVKFNIVGRDIFVTKDGVFFTGDGNNSSKANLIKNIPEQYLKNVHFLGFVEKDKLSKYYESCDVFVAPSLYESFGFIYIEAMSYAKPVIGCGVGGVPEVIKDGETGVLVPPEDHLSLAQAIITLLKNAQLRRKMGINARQDVEKNFNIDLMVERTLDAYKKALKII